MLRKKYLKSLSLFLVSILFVTMLMGVSFPGKASAATVGDVDLNGDPAFDSDSVSDNSNVDQTRWLSYPGSRFSLNANSINAYENVGPMETNLPLNMGGWIGTTWTNFQNTVNVQVAPIGGSYSNASSVSTMWYPYKITFNASYANPGTTLTGYDFNVDANGSVIRVIQVNGTTAKQVQLSGMVNDTGAVWDSTNRVVLVTGTNYYYAIRIVGLDGSMNPIELTESASVNGSTWTFTKQYDSAGTLGVSFGFATSGEGSSVAISRARGCLDGSVTTTLSTVKSYFDTQLRKAPKPANYGITGASQQGVTADRHRRVYYKAWTFTISNLMNVLPENSFAYKQVLCGKPSKWGSGDPSAPGSATWNSSMGIMSLVYIMPDEAWNAYQGLISLIDPITGQIPGESLPTRFAQVAWLLYQKTGDLTKLSGIYSNLKKHLLYAEQNPRWIHTPSGHDDPDERDMEFCNSFLWDAGFAAKIAQAVGESADISMWQEKRQTMLENMRTWFFPTPGVVFQYYYADTGERLVNEDHESMRNVAMSVENLPVDMFVAIKELFFSRCEPNEPIGGQKTLKVVTGDLVAYGLIDKGEKQAAYNFIHSVLRDSVRAKNFADVLLNPHNFTDVRPSAFGSTMVILFTWLANNMRIDSGMETAVNFGTITPKSSVVLEDFSAVGDWAASNASIGTAGGIGQITSNATYGYAAKSMTYNIDALPYITIHVPEVGAGCSWSVKVNDGGSDINIALNSTGSGEYTFDLKNPTGWSGNKTFDIKLYAAGGTGKYFKVDYLNAERSISPKVDNFYTIQDWTASNATIAASTTAYSSKVAQVTCGNASYGYVSKSITKNIDVFPYISINVPEIGSGCAWSLKVNDGGGDIDLILNSTQTGVLTADLKGLTGWSGNKTFNVKLYAAGGNGKYFKVDNINVCASRAVFDEFNSATDWTAASNATIGTSSGIATVTCTGSSYGYVAKSATYNVSAYPKIIINVPEVGTGCAWSLKVNDGSGDVDLVLNSATAGEFTCDLKSLTGWSGNKTFNVKLYTAGGSGKYFKADYIAVK